MSRTTERLGDLEQKLPIIKRDLLYLAEVVLQNRVILQYLANLDPTAGSSVDNAVCANSNVNAGMLLAPSSFSIPEDRIARLYKHVFGTQVVT